MTFEPARSPRKLCLGSLTAVAAVAGLSGSAAAQSVGETSYEPGSKFPEPKSPPPTAAPPVEAPAAPLATVPATAVAPGRHWYGYQLMLSDAAVIAMTFAPGGANGAAPFLALGLVADGPIVHGIHHNTGMAIASPFMRIGFAAMGGTIGASVAQCSDHEDFLDFCPLGQILVGMAAGTLVAMAVDYAMAWEVDAPPPTAPETAVRRSRSRLTLSSAGIAPVANGATLVMGGAF